MSRDIELRHLSYFVAVAEEAHFGRAAQRLFISQPSLSYSIRQLEERLGAQLLDRSDRRDLRLTNAGEAFLVHARDVLASVDRAVATVQALARQDRDQLNVGYNDGEPLARFPGLLGRSLRDANIDVAFRRLAWGTEADAVRDGIVDVVLTKLPIDAHGLVCEVLSSEPRLVCLRADHRLAQSTHLDLAALRDEPVVRPSGGTAEWVDFWRGEPRPDGTTPPDGPQTYGPEDTFDTVASGTAICFVPASMAQTVGGGLFRFVPVTDLAPVQTAVIWSEERTTPAHLNSFLGAVRSLLSQQSRESPPESETGG
jgi:DNA-binding transcriptional LysR family regulator